MSSLTKEQKHVILAIDLGNVLEWYDIYAFAYLSPILAKIFFPFESPLGALFSSFLVFGFGCFARVLGAIYFGKLGDHNKGRKVTFLISIVVTTTATILTGCLPSYQSWGITSLILLMILRFIQSFGAAGEFPGAICFLYENSHPINARFMTSWAGVGNQAGAILAVLETFLMEKFMTSELITSWGWRFSFWYGGLIGLFGIFLRSTLHETPLFEKLKHRHKLDTETEIEIIKNHPKQIALGIAFGAVNASTFYLLATYIPTYFEETLRLSKNSQFFITLSMLLITTALLPFFGKLGDKYRNRYLLIGSTLMIMLLLYPFYLAVNNKNLLALGIIGGLYIFPITCISGLLAYRLAHLFHTSIRFSGVGLSWNLTDGLIGGFSPAIAIFLLRQTNVEGSFCLFILLTALISLFAYLRIKD